MEATTLPFHEFWKWLAGHPNCILRAGTADAVLYDDEDLHWHPAGEGNETRIVQLLRGKCLAGRAGGEERGGNLLNRRGKVCQD